MTTTHYFTFGQSHMTNYPLEGRLADYWVAVELPDGDQRSHRDVFISKFTTYYCPSPNQFALEYAEEDFQSGYFPNGELLRING